VKRIRTFFKQLGETYRLTARYSPLIWLQLLVVFALVEGLFIGLGVLLGTTTYFAIIGVPIALLVTLLFFGPKARRAAYTSIEDQPGAAAAVLQDLRGGWFVTAGVAVNKSRDIVHRCVCRAGVVLVSEGALRTSRELLASEERRTSRFAPGTTVTMVSVGYEPGQIPLMKLQKHMRSLPKVLKPGQVTRLRQRLEALGAAGQSLPIPKGPMPRGQRPGRALRGR
jgi:hypothetical protein